MKFDKNSWIYELNRKYRKALREYDEIKDIVSVNAIICQAVVQLDKLDKQIPNTRRFKEKRPRHIDEEE